MKKAILLFIVVFIIPSILSSCAPTSKEPTATPTIDPLAGGPDRMALLTYAETALEDITKRKVDLDFFQLDSYEIDKTLLRYVIKGPFKVDEVAQDIIIKLEFEDNTFEYYKVFQLKINGINIDL